MMEDSGGMRAMEAAILTEASRAKPRGASLEERAGQRALRAQSMQRALSGAAFKRPDAIGSPQLSQVP